MPLPYDACPKCGHADLPADQAFPAACPACGVLLARVAEADAAVAAAVRPGPAGAAQDGERGLAAWLLHVPDEVDVIAFRLRVAALAAFAAWGLVLARLDVADGAMMDAFLHRPLLVFHEAGHVIFRPFGEWMGVFGGTLGQLLMPLVMAVALLRQNRDPFGASLALWLLGVSLLDVAPYVYDARHPTLPLLSGGTGADHFHDWIWLLSQGSGRALAHAQADGLCVHAAGVAVMGVALGWGAWVLVRQRARLSRPTASPRSAR